MTAAEEIEAFKLALRSLRKSPSEPERQRLASLNIELQLRHPDHKKQIQSLADDHDRVTRTELHLQVVRGG
jgi:hypothetical protein